MNMEVIWNFLSTQGADFALKIVGAVAAWIIGRWLIGIAGPQDNAIIFDMGGDRALNFAFGDLV